MPRGTARDRILGLLAALAAWMLVLSSCSKKELVAVPPPFGDVMGQPSASQLVVYPDVPLTTYFMLDTLIEDNGQVVRQNVCSGDDSLLGSTVERAGTSATVHGYIFDYTPASEFQIFHRDGSVYRLLKDYPLQPVKRYPYGNADVFTFDDPQGTASAFEDYVARGIVNGAITAQSPLTNTGHVTVTPTATVEYLGHLNVCGDPPAPGQPVDSLLAMSWGAIPGAAGYWVQVFQFGFGANVFASRFPSPALTERTVDYFLAYFPSTVTSYTIGDPLPDGSHLLTRRTLLNNTDYAVRITAVNDQGELIAYPSPDSRAYIYIRDPVQEGHYTLRSFGAVVVHTGNPGACPTNPPCGQALGTALPNVKLYPPEGLPRSLP